MNFLVLDSARPQVLGGIERALADLAARARTAGHDARAAGRRGSRFAAHCRSLGVPTLELPLRNAFDLPSLVRLRRLFREHRTVAVLGATTRDGRLAGLARLGSRRPRVVLLVGLPMMRDSLFHRVTYRHLVDALLTPTEWQRAQVHRYSFARRLPCLVAPDGVDESRFPPLAELAAARRTARAELGVPARRTVYLSAGHLVVRKNLEFLPPLLARLPRGAEWEWWIAGDGPREAALRAAAEEHRLSGRVRFLGAREDVPRLLLCADAVVMPSRAEQLPLVALEALRAGVPRVLVSAVGAVDEMRALGIETLPRDDPAAWLAALEGAGRDPGGCRAPQAWDRGAEAAAARRLEALALLAAPDPAGAGRPDRPEVRR